MVGGIAVIERARTGDGYLGDEGVRCTPPAANAGCFGEFHAYRPSSTSSPPALVANPTPEEPHARPVS
jgi:hypothetical protein